jgi:cyclohexanone monooxygenase
MAEMSPDERQEELERRWRLGGMNMLVAFKDELTNPDANMRVAEFVCGKIHEIVRSPTTSKALTPQGLYIGTKRLCVGTNYYETFNRDNVTLVDVRSTLIEAITASGLRTSVESYKLDVIVYATGFDAFTGALLAIDIRGSGGQKLSEKWSAGPRSNLGLMTAGFPNLFIMAGAGSPSVLSSMVTSIELHAEWIVRCLDYLRKHSLIRMEATTHAEEAWVEHLHQSAQATLYTKSPTSWYLGANIPGKPRIFMPYVRGVASYNAKLVKVSDSGYSGFILT